MLAPQGVLVIANFLPQITGAGYMDAVMNWWLIYQNEEDMKKL